MKVGLVLAVAAGVGMSTGCRSAFVDATVTNATAETLNVLEVDYPSASFGKDTLAAGQVYHYRFKVQGSGPVKVLWTDSEQHDHTAKGPELHEGAQGDFGIVIEPGGKVDWKDRTASAP